MRNTLQETSIPQHYSHLHQQWDQCTKWRWWRVGRERGGRGGEGNRREGGKVAVVAAAAAWLEDRCRGWSLSLSEGHGQVSPPARVCPASPCSTAALPTFSWAEYIIIKAPSQRGGRRAPAFFYFKQFSSVSMCTRVQQTDQRDCYQDTLRVRDQKMRVGSGEGRWKGQGGE